MSKNKVQFQKGYSLQDLFKNYGTERQCAEALFNWRCPSGFRCPHCGSVRHSIIKTRELYQCTDCLLAQNSNVRFLPNRNVRL